ncbi:hypothetical protein GWO13_06150 [Candidatus Bathyarchaeota archaeon]|nr:hypothetical protein [Candidatus Bathyarchaeota archaeon]
MSEEYEDLCTTAHVDEVIGESKELARVFLAINGKDSLEDISKKLGIPIKRVQQSSEILEENKLIFKINIPPGKSVVYSKPHWIRFQNIDDHIRVRFWIKDL